MKHTKMILIVFLVLVGNVLATNGYIIGRSVIAGSGQEAAGGNYIINGMIGESIASVLSVDTSYDLRSGFWWVGKFWIYLPIIQMN